MPRRRHRTLADRLGMRSALGRWGFTLCALVSYANGLYTPAILCTAVAIYAWRNR